MYRETLVVYRYTEILKWAENSCSRLSEIRSNGIEQSLGR